MELRLAVPQMEETDYGFLINCGIASAIFLITSTWVARKRSWRMQELRLRWKNIKELEEDYDVYVADEYAYHIADT